MSAINVESPIRYHSPSKGNSITYTSPTKRNQILRRSTEEQKSFDKFRKNQGKYSFIGQDSPGSAIRANNVLEPRRYISRENIDRSYSAVEVSPIREKTRLYSIDGNLETGLPKRAKKDVKFSGENVEIYESREEGITGEEEKIEDTKVHESVNQTVLNLQDLILQMAKEHKSQLQAMQLKIEQQERRISSLERGKGGV